MGERRKTAKVEDVLTDSQVCHIVRKCVGEGPWQLVDCKMGPAVEGLAGFIGDHFRLALTLRVEDQLETIPLFAKTVPFENEAKIKFIEENKFFSREMTVFKLIDVMEIGPNPCVAKALFCSESVLVMPDLAEQGYSTRNHLEPFDLPHALVALASVARFHAATANLETKRSLALHRPYSLMEEHGDVIIESTFMDTPWIRAGAKLTSNIVQNLSDKYKDAIPDFESKALKEFLAACEDLKESKDSLNVVLHKDLWVNNIMFKYKDGSPINAIIVDFQCVRYGPPAFDVMMLLYLTTSRCFRQQHESAVLRHYFDRFMEALDDGTRDRLKGLGYDFEEFLGWAEVGRKFGMVMPLVIFPYVLMEPRTASAVFDDADTFERLSFEDRTAPVLAHAQRCPRYRRRQLELTEEFVERYLTPERD